MNDVVVDMKITSTEHMNFAFKEKVEKQREWTMVETREKNVAEAVMVPIIISHDRAIHKDSVGRGRTSHRTSRPTGSEWRRVFSYTVSPLLIGSSTRELDLRGVGKSQPIGNGL